MKCREAQELMGAYLYGDLAPEEMHELRLHAQDCTLCREDLATRGRVVSALSDAPPVLSDTDRQRIAWSVKGAVRRKQARPRSWALRLAPALMLATAVLVAGFFAGRIAIRSPHQHSAHNPKSPDQPQAKIEVKETTTATAKPTKVQEQVLDALLSLVNKNATAPVSDRQSDLDRHRGGRGSITPPDSGVRMQPEPTSLSDQQPAKTNDSTATLKDSDATAKKTETGASTGETKLPRVTDPKNAETAPSDSQ